MPDHKHPAAEELKESDQATAEETNGRFEQ